MSKKLIVIQGPTASGKTALSISLAKQLNTCVLSADSRQFYKEMDIGTAKPSLQEQEGIKHYFIHSNSILDKITAATYERDALKILEEEFKTKDNIILVGGSGMFIDALCNGLDFVPHDENLRIELTTFVNEFGLNELLEELLEKDPNYYNLIDKKNPVRIIRAIEAIRISGKTFSELRKNKVHIRNFKIMKFVINLPREILYERINSRVDEMIKKGLINEVQQLVQYKNLQTLNTVAYSEMFEYLENIISLDEAIEKIKKNTRRYAKRQLTWFRKDENAIWLKKIDTEKMKNEVLNYLLQ